MSTSRNSNAKLSAPHKAIIRQIVNSKLRERLESKVFNYTQSAANYSSSGTVIALTQSLIQGDSISTRDGNKAVISEINLSLQSTLNTAALTNTVRVILFYDTMANGSSPTVSDVLNASTVTSLYQTVNVQKQRFKILMDYIKPLVTGGANQTVHLSRKFKQNTPIYWQDTTDVSGANSKNTLCMLLLSDAATNVPVYAFTVQVRFYDA